MSETFRKESKSGYGEMNDRTLEELQKADELTQGLDYRILPYTPNKEILNDSNQKVGEAADDNVSAKNDPTYHVEAEKIALADKFGADKLKLAEPPNNIESLHTDNDPNSLNAAQVKIVEDTIAGSSLEKATLSDNTPRREINQNSRPNNFPVSKPAPTIKVKKTGFFGKFFGG
jgi:hypothetical protein